MEFQEWFDENEVELNKTFCDKSGELFIRFCNEEYNQGISR